MARYTKTFSNISNHSEILNKIKEYLSQEGFKETNLKGEQVWKKGIGLLTAPQFIKISQTDSSITLEAWLKMAILPGVYTGEMGLNGFFGAIPKRALKKRVIHIETLIQ